MASTEETNTAQSHTPRTPPLSAALGASTDLQEASLEQPAAEQPAEDGGLDLTMKKKKKKKVAEDADGAEPTEGANGAADGGGLDLSMKKKKKKKAAKDDDFAAKLAALDLDKDGAEAEAGKDEKEEEQSGDMEKGTGIWQHEETRPVSYDLLLGRFFSLLAQKNPDHAMSGSRSYKIPPPQCMREGNKVNCLLLRLCAYHPGRSRSDSLAEALLGCSCSFLRIVTDPIMIQKTIFANIQEICKRMKRTEEHVTAYLVRGFLGYTL